MRLSKDQTDTVSNYIQNPRASRTTEEPLALNDSAGFGTTSSLTVTCVAAGLVDDFRSWMEAAGRARSALKTEHGQEGDVMGGFEEVIDDGEEKAQEEAFNL
ncbi:hypothetical protein WN943_028661 [Citrus x changshan-huyou]